MCKAAASVGVITLITFGFTYNYLIKATEWQQKKRNKIS